MRQAIRRFRLKGEHPAAIYAVRVYLQSMLGIYQKYRLERLITRLILVSRQKYRPNQIYPHMRIIYIMLNKGFGHVVVHSLSGVLRPWP